MKTPKTTKDLGLKCKYGGDCSICEFCAIEISAEYDDIKASEQKRILEIIDKWWYFQKGEVCVDIEELKSKIKGEGK